MKDDQRSISSLISRTDPLLPEQVALAQSLRREASKARCSYHWHLNALDAADSPEARHQVAAGARASLTQLSVVARECHDAWLDLEHARIDLIEVDLGKAADAVRERLAAITAARGTAWGQR